MLPDSGRIQEEDAANANRHSYSKHAPALPLYTEADAFRALTLLQPVGYDRVVPVADGVEVDFINAGHLLGSSYARVRTAGSTILFGGDLGRFGRPVLPDPTMVEEADYLLVESTYGNRVHEKDDDGEKLAQAIKATVERGGKVIIPAFAVGRVEELLYWIKRLEEEKRIPVLPVFVDSPMATEALSRYTERVRELDPELAPEERDEKAPHGRANHDGHARRATRTCAPRAPALRVLHRTVPDDCLDPGEQGADGVEDAGDCHLVERDGDRRPGTASPEGGVARPEECGAARGLPGRRHPRPLAGGRCAAVKIHGQMIPVHARVEKIDSMSAHADSEEVLRWLGGFTRPPRTTFLVHGEIVAMEALQATIKSRLGWNTRLPQHEETVELS